MVYNDHHNICYLSTSTSSLMSMFTVLLYWEIDGKVLNQNRSFYSSRMDVIYIIFWQSLRRNHINVFIPSYLLSVYKKNEAKQTQ